MREAAGSGGGSRTAAGGGRLRSPPAAAALRDARPCPSLPLPPAAARGRAGAPLLGPAPAADSGAPRTPGSVLLGLPAGSRAAQCGAVLKIARRLLQAQGSPRSLPAVRDGCEGRGGSARRGTCWGGTKGSPLLAVPSRAGLRSAAGERHCRMLWAPSCTQLQDAQPGTAQHVGQQYSNRGWHEKYLPCASPGKAEFCFHLKAILV